MADQIERIETVRLPGRAHDYVTVKQMADALVEQRKGIEQLLAATLGRYHAMYHGNTPPVQPAASEETPA